MARDQRLLEIYTGAAIAILFLVSTVNAVWLAVFALGLVAVGLVVFPAHRERIVTVALIGAATGLVVAGLVRVFAWRLRDLREIAIPPRGTLELGRRSRISCRAALSRARRAIIVAVVSMLAVAVELFPIARRDRAARPWAILAAASAVAVPAAIVVHNVASALIGGEEAVSFILALLVAPAGFAIGTFGSAVATLRSDRTLGARIMLAGLGLAIFAGYMLFALLVTTIEGSNPPYQAIVEPFALLAAALAMVAGAIGTALSLTGARPTGLSPFARQ